MKWVFVSVLLINAVYFIYNTFHNVDSNTNNQLPASQDKSQLVLLEELDKTELNALQNKVTLIDTTEQISTADLTVENTVSDTNQLIDKDKENIIDIDKENIIDIDKETIIDIDKETIIDIDKEAIIDKDKETIIAEDTGKIINLCYTLGPLTKIVMDDIRLELEKEYNNQLSFGIETTSPTTYYRIYIPPLKSKDKIKETLELLEKNDLNDHYVMSIDGRKNAIALGVFKKKDAAEKVAARVKNVGLSTTIEAISNDKNSLYTLHVIFQKTHDISKYQELIKQKNLESSSCLNNS